MGNLYKIYQQILDWSEVWIVLFGLLTFLIVQKKEPHLKVVAEYLLVALILNTLANIIQRISSPGLPNLLRYNNWLYNIHSFIITIFFVTFFKKTGLKLKWLNPGWIIFFFILGTIITFAFFASIFRINSVLFAMEGIILLLYSVSFFLKKLQDEEVNDDFDSALVVVTGLTIYEAINFFIFLFYPVLMTSEKKFVISLWDIHDYSYIVFCVFISYAFYGRKNTNGHFNKSSHFRNSISHIS